MLFHFFKKGSNGKQQYGVTIDGSKLGSKIVRAFKKDFEGSIVLSRYALIFALLGAIGYACYGSYFFLTGHHDPSITLMQLIAWIPNRSATDLT